MNIDFNTQLKSVYGADLIGPDTKVIRLGTVCVNAFNEDVDSLVKYQADK